jgi:uncharacterized protein with HEPN domain
MRPDDLDSAYLWDMREAARETARFLEDVTFEDFVENRILRLAVEREIEIIGEAARRVSANLRAAHPEIPWRPMIGQRNVLAHEYSEVEIERLWLVAKERLPELIELLNPLIPESELSQD